MKNRLFVMCTGAMLVSCSGPDRTAPTFAFRDSSGIQIIESRLPAWDSSAAWRVDSVPDFDLSEQQEEKLSRIGNARFLSDGRLIILNRGACEVRLYNESGELLASAGRCGKGPGEFDDQSGLWPWQGDSVVVVDQLTRITILAGDGTYVRTARLPPSDSMPIPFIRGVLHDGTLVLVGLRDPVGRVSPGVDTGRFTLALLRGSANEPQIIGSYPGPVFEYTQMGERIGRGRLAFSSSTEFAAGANSIYVGYPDRYEIHVYEANGDLRRILRRPFTSVQVERRDIDWLMERRLTQVEGAENQRVVRQAFRDLQHAERMPAFGPPVWPGGSEGGPAMLVDADGNLWVFDNYRPGEYRNQWTIFSTEGVWLGTITLPHQLTPSQIGADYVVGSWMDDTGFVHIRRHRIHKP